MILFFVIIILSNITLSNIKNNNKIENIQHRKKYKIDNLGLNCNSCNNKDDNDVNFCFECKNNLWSSCFSSRNKQYDINKYIQAYIYDYIMNLLFNIDIIVIMIYV